MSEIIQKWLTDRLGVVLDVVPEKFAHEVKDGKVIANILYAYGLISNEQCADVVVSEDVHAIRANMAHIIIWLDALKIPCSMDTLQAIGLEMAGVSLRFFYQLYLSLQDRTIVSTIARRGIENALRPLGARFDVRPVKETKPDPSIIPDHKLSFPLVDDKDVIRWHHDRYASLMERYKQLRQEYIKRNHERFGTGIEDKFLKVGEIDHFSPKRVEIDMQKVESLHQTYDELREEQQRAEEMEKFKPDPQIAKAITSTIKHRHHKAAEANALKVQMNKLLFIDLWEKILSDQEKVVEQAVSQKMMRQSIYEKQLATKVFDVREQREVMLENRQHVDNLIQKEKDDEFLEQVFDREKSVGDQKNNYYFERDRILELHKRLYEEKLRLRAERHYNFCQNVAENLVNLAMINAEYKESFRVEPCRRLKENWTTLFIKEQPIFDIISDVEDVVQDLEDVPEEMEEMFGAEITRQDVLDQGDFDNYCNFQWPWELDLLVIDYEEDLHQIQLAMNVLGHIVHRVLLAKYPKPAPPPPPDIPKVTVAACINGITDPTILPVLQKLLVEREIKIIEIPDAVNFCLDAYKNESIIEYPDTVFVEETDEALTKVKGKKKGKKDKKKKKDKPKKKGEKTKGKKDKKKKPLEVESCISLPKFADKHLQTPRLFPCEELVLTVQAELGQVAYERLNLGEPLTDQILVNMVVLYLISLKKFDIKGWALVNFPTNYDQAALLEEALTAIPVRQACHLESESHVSIQDFVDLDMREYVHPPPEEDPNLESRKSRILTNPDRPVIIPFYESYLTAFINLTKKTDAETGEPNLYFETYEEELTPLDRFYYDQGCNYAFYYRSFEYATIKHLAKLILGEYTIPAKTSLELFGDTVLYLEAEVKKLQATPGKESKTKKKGEKKEKKEKKKSEKSSAKTEEGKDDKKKGKKDKKSKKDKSEKGSKKSKSEKGSKKKGKKGAAVEIVAVIKEDKETQAPELELEVEEIPVEPPPPPRPGEEDWEYVHVLIPDFFQGTLAVLWENTEDVYICDFKELFFIKRILLNAIIPYITYVNDHMKSFIERPDNKQYFLHEFQLMYNEIDEDLRDDAELKAEVHCRIKEFREKLWAICDNRMKESEAERQRIIADNWVSRQVTELTNNVITAMQIEIDRCNDTYKLLTDYYTSSITKMPSEEPQLEKTQLPKLEIGLELELKPSIEKLMDFVVNLLKTPGARADDTPFHQKVNKTYKNALEDAEKFFKNAQSAHGKMDALFQPKGGKKKEKKAKPKKEKGSKGKDSKKLPKFTEPDPEVKEAAARLIEEWGCTLDGELTRVKLRLEVIKKLAVSDFRDVFNCTQKTFHDLYQDILDRYEREMNSVHLACEVLGAALEAEVQIQPEMVLIGDQFIVEPNVLLFPDPPIPPEPSIQEDPEEGVFTIGQLDIFCDILFDLAPNGSIPERAFTYLLQDAIVQNAEDGCKPMVPKLWTQLGPKNVAELSQKLFGNVEFVCWKDFMIYNFGVTFPKEEELLEVRQRFREYDPDLTELVKDYQFFEVIFWFEKDCSPEVDPIKDYRIQLLKIFLYKLYRVNEDSINYTSLLLDFCKNDNPVLGFALALELSLGKLVCWEPEVGEMFLEAYRIKRQREEEEELARQALREEAEEAAESICDTLIDTTVHVCDSVVIEDVKNSVDLSLTDIEFLDFMGATDEVVQEEIGEEVQEEEDQSEEGSEEGIITESQFSNIEIGYEELFYPPKAYFLPFETLLTVITSTLPWHARVQNLDGESLRERVEVLYETLKRDEFNGAVLTHEFLSNKFFNNLLYGGLFKYSAKDPVTIVKTFVKEVQQ